MCKECRKIWTKECPFRTRDKHDRSPKDTACSEFRTDFRRYTWNGSTKVIRGSE